MMIRQTTTRILIGIVGGVLAIAAMASSASAQGTALTGKVTLQQANGSVMVDGKPAAKGDVIVSGAMVQTAQNSSAMVGLGKLSRVEVLPESAMTLNYSDSDFTASMLSQGRVRLSTSSGTAMTNDAEIKTNRRGRSAFLVDSTCGNTFVSVKVGRVELRAGNSVKQIAAGGQDTAGTTPWLQTRE